ncbi:hypothetical protein QBC41DRAFT_298954 [Cercophora samala]|uniref:Uncharacterized protein n=1 Tax=Cercophora samala TaxID=330535 RepID=A0AA39ZLD6_9PEZI|nr:hypothetical protein QBC41DRAFT_298954 [Cercophora samala]
MRQSARGTSFGRGSGRLSAGSFIRNSTRRRSRKGSRSYHRRLSTPRPLATKAVSCQRIYTFRQFISLPVGDLCRIPASVRNLGVLGGGSELSNTMCRTSHGKPGQATRHNNGNTQDKVATSGSNIVGVLIVFVMMSAIFSVVNGK